MRLKIISLSLILGITVLVLGISIKNAESKDTESKNTVVIKDDNYFVNVNGSKNEIPKPDINYDNIFGVKSDESKGNGRIVKEVPNSPQTSEKVVKQAPQLMPAQNAVPAPKVASDSPTKKVAEKQAAKIAPDSPATKSQKLTPPTKPGPQKTFVPQGKSNTEDIVRAQRENKQKLQVGTKEETPSEGLNDAENQYRILGNLYLQRMLLEAEDKIMAIKRKRILDQKKFEDEISIKSDNSDFERLMGMGLPSSAQPLPIVKPNETQPVVDVKLPEPPIRRDDEQPPLRVVGIQGYRGKFTAQIMNNGGITNISPGMDLEGGVHILEISDRGVKVRRTKSLSSGESKTEVIMLPLSR